MYKKLLLSITIACCIFSNSYSQNFDCYVANDTIISSTVYQFDVYLKATSADFYLRAIQLGLKFNPNFFQQGDTVTGSVVAGSTELISYTGGASNWNSTVSCLSVPANASSCNGTTYDSINTHFITGQPKRIATYRLTSTLPFNCATPDISMIRPSDPAPALGVVKMAVTTWSSTCLAVTISNNGTWTNYNANTLYSTVNNLPDTTCTTGVNELSERISVYPNPVHGRLTISSDKVIGKKIRLYNVSSQLELEKDLSGNPTREVTIDVSHLAPGIYFLRVDDAGYRRVVLCGE